MRARVEHIIASEQESRFVISKTIFLFFHELTSPAFLLSAKIQLKGPPKVCFSYKRQRGTIPACRYVSMHVFMHACVCVGICVCECVYI